MYFYTHNIIYSFYIYIYMYYKNHRLHQHHSRALTILKYISLYISITVCMCINCVYLRARPRTSKHSMHSLAALTTYYVPVSRTYNSSHVRACGKRARARSTAVVLTYRRTRARSPAHAYTIRGKTIYICVYRYIYIREAGLVTLALRAEREKWEKLFAPRDRSTWRV